MLEDEIEWERIKNALDLEHEAGIELIHGRRYAPDTKESGKKVL